jgi:hypothetical protein
MLHCFFSKPVAIDLPIGEIPCRVGYRAVWDTVPCGIPCSVDTVPCGIPCRAGYRAVWDTVLCGLRCCVGYVPCGGSKTVRALVPILSPIG